MISKKILLALGLGLVVTGCGVEEEMFCPGALKECDGNRIQFDGVISDIPEQHMVDIKPGYASINYFDTERFGQIVVYSKSMPESACRHMVITGGIIKIEGESKRPGSDELFVEYQVLADELKCK